MPSCPGSYTLIEHTPTPCAPSSSYQVDEIVMIAEDILGRVLTCMGQKDDTTAKGLLAGKVRRQYFAPHHVCFPRLPLSSIHAHLSMSLSTSTRAKPGLKIRATFFRFVFEVQPLVIHLGRIHIHPLANPVFTTTALRNKWFGSCRVSMGPIFHNPVAVGSSMALFYTAHGPFFFRRKHPTLSRPLERSKQQQEIRSSCIPHFDRTSSARRRVRLLWRGGRRCAVDVV